MTPDGAALVHPPLREGTQSVHSPPPARGLEASSSDQREDYSISCTGHVSSDSIMFSLAVLFRLLVNVRKKILVLFLTFLNKNKPLRHVVMI